MSSSWRVPFFEPYFRRLELEACRRDAEANDAAVRQMLELVQREQQGRLRVMQQKGPWDAEREVIERQQRERAYETLVRLKRCREMRRRIDTLQEQLPPATGLGRMRYANPWILVYGFGGLAVALNAVSLLR